MAPTATLLIGVLTFSLAAWVSATSDQSSSRPPAFYLAGDSTTAVQSAGGGGWGSGFLALLKGGATGKNYGRNGATTKSFMQQAWPAVLSSTAEAKGAVQGVCYDPGMLLHMDRLSGPRLTRMGGGSLATMTRRRTAASATRNSPPTCAAWPATLSLAAARQYAPRHVHWHLLIRPQILVTPLTRRSFSGSAPADNLARQRELTLSAAKAGGIKVIDLNTASRKYVAAIGKAAAARYNLKDGDNTHLNAHGSKVFGRMVADLIVQVVPDLKVYFKEDAAMTAAIRNGRPG